MNFHFRIIAAAIYLFLAGRVASQEIISLAGAWDFSLSGDGHYDDYVMLPGSMLTNGKGHPVTTATPWTGSLYDSSYYYNPYMEKYRREGQLKLPFFLTPDRHYVGEAWYKKTVYIPRNWSDRRVTLFLERAHIETTAWVNGQEAGHQASLSTPHRFDVTQLLKPGERNEIVLRVYNGTETVGVGQDSHSVTDQTQGNWNGVVGRIELQAQWKQLGIRQVVVRPDFRRHVITVHVELYNHAGGVHLANAQLQPMQGSMAGRNVAWTTAEIRGQAVNLKFRMTDDMMMWDQFTPNLYRLLIQVGDDEYSSQIGLRQLGTDGRQLTINGRPLFLRGTVGSCCFPETGYPPTDEAEWIRIFTKCKEWGLNHMRFHSYCPPEAAFTAADRLGFYLQVEGPSWPNHGVALGRGQKIDEYLMGESRRILDEYGHHPSFIMMAAGNEPAGNWVAYCNGWVKAMKDYDPTKLYAGASVGGGWAWDDGSEYHVKGGARGLDEWNRQPPSSDNDYSQGLDFPRNYKGTTPNGSPIIAHEQGQWCAFPDLSETSQYTGPYKARNFEIFSDLLRDGGMAAMSRKFLMASGRLQTLCYKYEIERNLRTGGYAGFQLLGLNDYSGQGTALVGPLNVHWREKGYCTADEWREFCSILVPLARFPKFVYTNRDTLRVPIEVYNAFANTVTEVKTTYYITNDSGRVVSGGLLSKADIRVGKNQPLGTVVMALDSISRPVKLTLIVRFSEHWKNHWDFWVYPESTPEPAKANKVAEFSEFSDRAAAVLRRGGTVLLTAAGRVTLGSDVKQTYLPVFWNTSWFKMRPPHTTGAYIDTTHPLFRHGFPTDSWSNLNWWELLNGAQVMNLMELPADYQPPIQPIDTWHVSRKLGMLIEARVGKGRLLMTTMDINTDLEHRPVARQMRRALMSYMQSKDFSPSLVLTPEVVSHFFTRQAPPVNMFTNDSPDELKPKLK